MRMLKTDIFMVRSCYYKRLSKLSHVENRKRNKKWKNYRTRYFLNWDGKFKFFVWCQSSLKFFFKSVFWFRFHEFITQLSDFVWIKWWEINTFLGGLVSHVGLETLEFEIYWRNSEYLDVLSPRFQNQDALSSKPQQTTKSPS